MKKIQMVDLATQYQAIKSNIDSSVFIGGLIVQRFQKSLELYLGVKHVIPYANDTDALQIAMMAPGLKPGDEVILLHLHTLQQQRLLHYWV